MKKNVHLIVRLQAWARGCRVRKNLPAHMKYRLMQRQSYRIRPTESLVQSGPLDYDDMSGVEDRQEYVFKNGARYVGQWKGDMRHGYGEQTWADGAKYAGDWRFNKAHGKGTFWHITGDKYEGHWKDDKAHGYGVYTHSNGARY
jgi:hypothetical protein